jgi:hypothetical protein
MIWLAVLLTMSLLLLTGVALWGWNRNVLRRTGFNRFAHFWHRFKQSPSRFRKVFTVLGFLLLFSGTTIGFLNVSTRLVYIRPAASIDGTAQWRDLGPQRYLYVEASDRYSLGYLQGQFLAKEITNFRFALIATGLSLGMSYSSMMNQARNYKTTVPHEYLLEMQGMADGASRGSGWIFTLDDILLQNCFLDLAYGHWIPQEFALHGPLACTDVGAKNANGSIVLGQNFDFPVMLGRNGLFPSLSFVHTNLLGVHQIFGLRLGAVLSLPVGRTSANLTMVVTVIETNIFTNYSTPAVVVARMAMEAANSIDEIIGIVGSYEFNCGYTNLITDGTRLVGSQTLPLGYRLRNDTTNPTMVNTNRYIYDDWHENYFADGNYSTARQLYVERLVREKYDADSTLSYSELIEILGTTEHGPEGPNSAPCYNQDQYGAGTLAVLTTNEFGIGTVHDGLAPLPF